MNCLKGIAFSQIAPMSEVMLDIFAAYVHDCTNSSITTAGNNHFLNNADTVVC
jgi:hypothetical protein